MIYNYRKYKSVDDFVKNIPKGKKDEPFTILHKCQGAKVTGSTCTFNVHCFGCLFCALHSPDVLSDFENAFGAEWIAGTSKNAFSGKPIAGPKPRSGFKHPYSSLEKFTGVDETTNIQPWAAGLLSAMGSSAGRVGMEIPIFNQDYDRNGRLDIGIMVNDTFLAVESKISLDDALKDERFIEQHVKYTVEIEKSTENYTYLTLFGGCETDLLPPDSPYCTGMIGDKTNRFYNMLIENGIQFITANALWCLCCKYLSEGPAYCWDRILVDIFHTPECIGLCSAGIIKKTNTGFMIASL